jgi:hypothetical protein
MKFVIFIFVFLISTASFATAGEGPKESCPARVAAAGDKAMAKILSLFENSEIKIRNLSRIGEFNFSFPGYVVKDELFSAEIKRMIFWRDILVRKTGNKVYIYADPRSQVYSVTWARGIPQTTFTAGQILASPNILEPWTRQLLYNLHYDGVVGTDLE